ncbi:MAG: type II secretion system protein GspK [Pirellulales bacterium]
MSARKRQRHHRYRHTKKPAFLLLLVMLVIAIASLATLNFGRAMLLSNESAKMAGGRLQARMCAESGAQAVRLFLAYPAAQRQGMGGTWSNPGFFYAKNVIPAPNAQMRGNFSVIAPALDQEGNFSGVRFGLQNESAKLNLNALVQLDTLVQSGAMAGSAASALTGGTGTGGSSTGGNNSGGNSSGGNNNGGNNSGGNNNNNSGNNQNSGNSSGGSTSGGSSLASQATQLASQATASTTATLARNILMSLPGMTMDLADSILDWLDEDDDMREYGAEYDYYAGMQPAYKPANGPMESIEQLLLVKGMTPQILYGYDQNRNGFLDPTEQQMQTMGSNPMGGMAAPVSTDPNASKPSPLGLAAYLTLHSQEKNVASDGTPRININGDDLTTLYEDLKNVLDEDKASFIIGYRIGGVAQTNPLVTLASMAAQDAAGGDSTDGAMGTQLQSLLGASQGAGTQGQGQNNKQPWSAAALQNVDLTQGGKVKFQQVLDLFDATVTMAQGQNAQNAPSFKSPFTSLPGDMAVTVPILMDKLTTTDSKSVPGRINIMECPREILMGIPGLSDDTVQQIITARTDSSDAETRKFEAWLAIEGYLTIDQLRGLTPLICCGGDVFKAQIVGYLEGDAAFSRIETIVSGAGDLPLIQFYRRLDHLGRGFSVSTLGQRPDALILNQ